MSESGDGSLYSKPIDRRGMDLMNVDPPSFRVELVKKTSCRKRRETWVGSGGGVGRPAPSTLAGTVYGPARLSHGQKRAVAVAKTLAADTLIHLFRVPGNHCRKRPTDGDARQIRVWDAAVEGVRKGR